MQDKTIPPSLGIIGLQPKTHTCPSPNLAIFLETWLSPSQTFWVLTTKLEDGHFLNLTVRGATRREASSVKQKEGDLV